MSTETCEFGCCIYSDDGSVQEYAAHPPSCHYCEADAVGRDADDKLACQGHIEDAADWLRDFV